MSAYYNEHDPFAAKWLRELIKVGHIADGEVDERSIEDVLPSDLAGFTQCHFFAGIGVWSYALKQAGWPDDEPVWTGSCPCQPFSTAGKRAGIADERHLWPSWFHLIAQRRPPVIFGEQVEAAVRQGWLDLVQADLEGLDYACGPVGIPAAGFGAPHARQRLYFAAERVDDTASQRRQHEQDGGRSKLARNGKAERRSESGIGSSISDLADASNVRCLEQRPAEAAALQGQCTKRGREHPQPGHDGELSRRPEGLCRSGGVADAGCELSQRRTDEQRPSSKKPAQRSQETIDNQRCSSVVGLADNEHAGLQGWIPRREDSQRPDQYGHAGCSSTTSDLENAGCGEQSQRGNAIEVLDEWHSASRPASEISRSGPTNGFWAAADWLWCRDEKYRPVEPGTFPLAHGSPNRVGRLRGYGNAIVAPQAEAFIRAYIETRQIQGAKCQR